MYIMVVVLKNTLGSGLKRHLEYMTVTGGKCEIRQ